MHDPTVVNRLEPETTNHRYRSAIFFHSPEQHGLALETCDQQQARYRQPIRTQIERAGRFWLAEAEHQQHLEQRGAYATVYQTGRRSFPWAGPQIAEGDGEPDELVTEFGPAFSTFCTAARIRLVLLDDEQHFTTIVNCLRRWVNEQPTPSSPGATIRKVRLVSRVGSASTELSLWARATQLTLFVNHQTTNPLPVLEAGPYLFREAPAKRDPSDPDLDRFGALGSGLAHRGSQTRLVDGQWGPFVRGYPDDATDCWYEHVPDVELELECGAKAPHLVRWRSGQLGTATHGISARTEVIERRSKAICQVRSSAVARLPCA